MINTLQSPTMHTRMQSGADTGEQTSVDSSTDIGDADLDAIIAAGGSFDDQSATGASGLLMQLHHTALSLACYSQCGSNPVLLPDMYQQLDDEESNFPQKQSQVQASLSTFHAYSVARPCLMHVQQRVVMQEEEEEEEEDPDASYPDRPVRRYWLLQCNRGFDFIECCILHANEPMLRSTCCAAVIR